MIISSQRFIDQDTVEEKIASNDFEVTIATITTPDGEEFKVVVDGHHSYAAAIQSGNKPIFVEANYNYQSEVDCLGFRKFSGRNKV